LARTAEVPGIKTVIASAAPIKAVLCIGISSHRKAPFGEESANSREIG
jgi:hypothetical protein